MKKLISALLILCLLIGLTSVGTMAASAEEMFAETLNCHGCWTFGSCDIHDGLWYLSLFVQFIREVFTGWM